MASFKKLFSPQALRSSLSTVWRRFPVPVIYLSALTVWLIVLIFSGNSIHYTFAKALSNSLCEGLLLALAANIWCGYLKLKNRVVYIQSLIFVLVAIDFVYILLHGWCDNTAEAIGRAAFYTAIVTALFFLPCAASCSRSQLYDYTLHMLGAAMISAFISIALELATLIIFGSIFILFQQSEWKLAYACMIVLSLWIPGMVLLHNIPRRKTLTTGSAFLRPGVAIICKMIMLPVVTIYAAILLIYGFKILIAWSLPNASITWMVTGLMCVSLITLYGLQHYTFGTSESTGYKLTTLARRWLPIILLPLLLLMTVGLIYRINQYGITAARLYTAAFDVWAFGVVIYMIMRKSANLNHIAVSFAAVFMLVSIIPGFNLTTLSNSWIHHRIVATLASEGIEEYPISETRLKDVLSKMPQQDAENLVSRLAYLDDYNDHSGVSDIVISESQITEWTFHDIINSESPTAPTQVLHILAPSTVDIPEGYNHVIRESIHHRSGKLENISGSRYKMSTAHFETEIDMDSLRNIPRGEVLKLTMGTPDTSVVIFPELKIKRNRGADPELYMDILNYYYFTK